MITLTEQTFSSPSGNPGPLSFSDQFSYPRSRGNTRAMASNETGVGRNFEKYVGFRHINRYISENVEDKHVVTMEDE